MQRLKQWVNIKIYNLIHNWYFALILGITIGFTFNFCYVNGIELYKEIFAVRTVKIAIANSASEAKEETVNAGQGQLVVAHNPSGVDYLLEKYFGEEKDLARAVMMCESMGEADRIGDIHLIKPSVGLFQINQIWHPYTTKELQDPETNIRIAKEIRDKGSWDRWTCFKTGGYKKYL